MMYFIGLSMMGGYFGLLRIIIPFIEQNSPSIVPVSFVIISVLYMGAMMKLQTRIEKFYIKRHVEKNPDSTWRDILESNA